MAFAALLDTCVLYPAYLCDTLLRLAEAEAYRPLWSADTADIPPGLSDNGLFRAGELAGSLICKPLSRAPTLVRPTDIGPRLVNERVPRLGLFAHYNFTGVVR